MSSSNVQTLLASFSRQVRLIRVIRIVMVIGTVVALTWAASLPRPDNKRLMFAIFIGTMVLWALSMISSARVARRLQTASALLSVGQLEDAEVWLRRVLEQFSLSARSKLVACQQFASLFFRRDDHNTVVLICRELLKHRLSRLGNVCVNARLMLTDSLLMQDRVAEAYEAIRPVYDADLSLADRMKLLPLQLRYELAADHPETSVQSMAEKLRVAELLDSPRAALVHALLAEACRRRNMPEQQAFLAERAWLYHDLDQLASRYPLIAPIAAQKPAAASPPPNA